ncbi:MAG TPA: acetylornithine aminotransferase, partial [Bdellovibrionales bacterium]|nr:acetylornithine aminotransferase [Bdellovibrionales bacterium]
MSETVGSKNRHSTKFLGLVESLTTELLAAGDHLQGIQPPKPEFQGDFQSSLKDIAKFRGRPLFYDYIGTGVGNGPYVELEDGSVKLDLINGIGVHIMGHSHPVAVKGAIQGAASDIVMQGNLQPNEEYLEIQKVLSDLAGRNSRL